MIVYHQSNVAAKPQGHVIYAMRGTYDLTHWVISKTSAGAPAFFAAHYYYSQSSDTV